MKVCLVAGTHGFRGQDHQGQWWWPTSPFAQLLEAAGVEVLGKGRPFVWTTDVNGVVGEKIDWRVGGENLYQYLVPSLCTAARVAPAETAVVAHSHGLQVALFAAAAGLKIASLVSVCSPVRGDMFKVAEAARPNIAHWTHIYSPGDFWQGSGELNDGHFGIVRTHPLADRNEKADDVGHTGVLEDPRHFPLWTLRGWVNCLRSAAP